MNFVHVIVLLAHKEEDTSIVQDAVFINAHQKAHATI